MIRSTRQTKIVEKIMRDEVDTQEELVYFLRDEGFNVTQATVSRDMKELGVIKVSGTTKKYRYAIADDNYGVSAKTNDVFKSSILGVEVLGNQVVLTVIKDTANLVCNIIDKMSLANVLGTFCGVSAVLVIARTPEDAEKVHTQIINKMV